MKRLSTLLLFSMCLFSLGCGDCENDTFEVNPNLLNWLSHEESEQLNFQNQLGEEKSFLIERGVYMASEDDGECDDVSVQPYIFVFDPDITEHVLNVWLAHQPDLIEDRDRLWGIYQDEGGNILESGSRIVNVPESLSTTVNLNGVSYEDVLVLELGDDSTQTATIYLQKNEGLIGFHLGDQIWNRGS